MSIVECNEMQLASYQKWSAVNNIYCHIGNIGIAIQVYTDRIEQLKKIYR